MAKHSDEMSLGEGAQKLGVHRNTLRNWAIASLTGEPSRIKSIELRRDLTLHIWIKSREVKRLECENLALELAK